MTCVLCRQTQCVPIYAQLMYIINLLCRSEQYRDDVHQGLYRCRARNRLGTILSRLVRVNAGKQLLIGSIFPWLYYHLFFCNFFTSIFPTYVTIIGLITFKIALQKMQYQVTRLIYVEEKVYWIWYTYAFYSISKILVYSYNIQQQYIYQQYSTREQRLASNTKR